MLLGHKFSFNRISYSGPEAYYDPRTAPLPAQLCVSATLTCLSNPNSPGASLQLYLWCVCIWTHFRAVALWVGCLLFDALAWFDLVYSYWTRHCFNSLSLFCTSSAMFISCNMLPAIIMLLGIFNPISYSGPEAYYDPPTAPLPAQLCVSAALACLSNPNSPGNCLVKIIHPVMCVHLFGRTRFQACITVALWSFGRVVCCSTQ